MAQRFTTPISIAQLSSAASDAISVLVDGDTNPRVKIEAGGRLSWGDGTGAGDVVLYRDSANLLKTEDTFQATGGVATITNPGPPPNALVRPVGTLLVDSTNDAFYFYGTLGWTQITGGGGGGGGEQLNIDGGDSDEIFGGIESIDGGTA